MTDLVAGHIRPTSGNRGMTGNHPRGTDVHQHWGQCLESDFAVTYITIQVLVSPRRTAPHASPALGGVSGGSGRGRGAPRTGGGAGPAGVLTHSQGDQGRRRRLGRSSGRLHGDDDLLAGLGHDVEEGEAGPVPGVVDAQ